VSPVDAKEVPHDLDGRHSVREAAYRGWLIRYHKGREWTAELFRPGSAEAISQRLVASADEGEIMLIQRAQRTIDLLNDKESTTTWRA
jgi:hypothetical protein